MLRRVLFFAVLSGLAVSNAGRAELEIRGRVVDDSERPVARASVELAPILPLYERYRAILDGHIETEPVSKVRTSVDGRYVLEVPEPGMWQVLIRARRKIPVRNHLTPLTESIDLPDAKLRADAGLEIRVVDPEGGPVRGAQVWTRSLERSAWGRRTQWRERGQFGVTDENGRVRLARAAGESQRIRAWAAGFLVSEDGVTVDGDSGTVALRRGHPLSLRFGTSDGQPTPEAVVAVQSERRTFIAGSTDTDGRMTLALQPDRPLALEIRLADGTSFGSTLERREHELVNPSPKADRIEVATAIELSGSVVDRERREPVSGAFVWPSRNPGHFARTDAEGVYRLRLSAGKNRRIGGGAAGYRSEYERVEVSAGSQDGPLIALGVAATLVGRVADGEGQGVAGAQVTAVRSDAWDHPKTRTGADGRFRLTGLDPESVYEVVATARDFVPARQTVRPAPDLSIELVLDPGRALVGFVVDEGGAPIGGAKISLFEIEADLARRMRGQAADDSRRSTESNPDGSFRIRGLGDRPVALLVRSAGYATQFESGIDISGDQPVVDAGEIVLAAGAEIHGVVQTANDSPIEGASVHAGSMSFGRPIPRAVMQEMTKTAASGADGTFVLSDLPKARAMHLWVDHEDYLRESVQGILAGNEKPVEIVLKPAGRLSGRVVDEQRGAVGGARILATPLEPKDGLTPRFGGFSLGTQRSQSREDGSFLMTKAPPGKIEVKAEAQGYLPSEPIEIQLAEGGEKSGLVLVLRRGTELSGSVRDTEGRPVGGAEVRARPITSGGITSFFNRRGASTRTDGSGNFSIAGLETGEIALTVTHDEYVEHEESLDFKPGMRRDIVLQSGTTVSGFVLNDAGEPISGAEVGVTDSARNMGSKTTSRSLDDGSFEISGVGAGSYRLRVSKSGFATTTSEAPFQVAASPVRGLTVYLKTGGTIRGQIAGLGPEELGQVEVFVTGVEQGLPSIGFVGADGNYRVPNVGFEKGLVAGRSPATGQTVQQPFELDTDGGETWVDLEFASGAAIAGKVLLDGDPWPGAQVSADGGPGSQGGAQSDQEGRFEIRGLSSGRHRVSVFGRMGGLHTEYVDVAGDTQVTIDVKALPVSGLVVNADSSEPIEGASVVAETSDVSPFGAVARATTSARGEFELRLAAGGRYSVRAQAAGYAEETVVVSAGSGNNDPLTLRLEPTDSVEVALKLWSGIQPEFASFAVLDDGRRVWAGWARATDGRFRLGSIPAGEWTLMVEAPESAITSVPIRVPGPPIEIGLAQESRISVDLSKIAGAAGLGQLRLLSPNGAPLLRAEGGLREDWPVRRLLPVLTGVPAGSWIVEYSDVSGAVWRRPVTTRTGETANVTLE